MYYEVHGSGEPLVLLHGSYMTIDTMGPLLSGLAESRRVIAVELQGHGRTADVDRPLTHEQMADDTAGLCAGSSPSRPRSGATACTPRSST
jgi:pimeloyl-ACP methyl ester carboxylesterase